MLLIGVCLTSRFWRILPHDSRDLLASTLAQGGGCGHPWISLLVYMSKPHLSRGAASPAIYPFSSNCFFEDARGRACHEASLIGTTLVKFTFLLACMAVVLTPSRRSGPGVECISVLEARFPAKPIILRARNVYSAYANRHDLFAPLLAGLPRETNNLDDRGGRWSRDRPLASFALTRSNGCKFRIRWNQCRRVNTLSSDESKSGTLDGGA